MINYFQTWAYSFVLIFAFTLLPYIVFCNSHDTRPSAFIIEKFEAKMQNKGNNNNIIGKTISFEISFMAKVKGTYDVAILFPTKLRLLSGQTFNRRKTFSITLDSGQIYSNRDSLSIFSQGESLICLGIALQNAPKEYIPAAERWLEIEHRNRKFEVRYDTSSIIKKPRIVKTSNTTVLTLKNGSSLQSALSVNVQGRVHFQDTFDGFQDKGVYGVSVGMYFTKTSDDNCTLYELPVYTASSTCDESGNFSFNFTISEQDIEIGQYDQVTLIVSKSNSAAIITSGSGLYIQNANLATATSFNIAQGFEIPFTPGTNNLTYSGIDIEINPPDARILRYMQISKEFTVKLYGNNETSMPFRLPQVKVQRTSSIPDPVLKLPVQAGGLSDCGFWNGDPTIYLRDISYNYYFSGEAVYHEYGHYVNWMMWIWKGIRCSDILISYGISLGAQELIEGWAEFFSFAARNYASRQYLDGMYLNQSNWEEAPYFSPKFYQASGYSGSAIARADNYAAYLWNIYDKYDDPVFQAPFYSNGRNNDDVGLGSVVFEIMRANYFGSFTNPTFFHFALKTFTTALVNPANLDDFKAALDRIYCFFFGNCTEMGSAQITNLNISPSKVLSWNSRSYTSISAIYKNRESGYKVYHRASINDSWSLLATLPYSFFSTYTLPANIIDGECKVTAYNPAGDSYDPPTVNIRTTLTLSKRTQGIEVNSATNSAVAIINISPSPASVNSQVSFRVLEAGYVTIEILDQLGQVRSILINQEYRNEGDYVIDANVNSLISGTYQYRIRSGSSSHSKPLVVLK